MGIENNECLIITTSIENAMERLKGWISMLDEEPRSLFVVIKSIVNCKYTFFMGPCGNHKGWGIDIDCANIRDRLIEFIETFNREDGGNPFEWIEVGYGEFGQKVLRGNCINRYNDEPYYTGAR